MYLLPTYVHLIVSSYVVDTTGQRRFLIVFILPPLLVTVACQGYFDEDHFRCRQLQCSRPPAVSLTGYC
jgi:hypothetical protein